MEDRVQAAIDDEVELVIDYSDKSGQVTQRTIRPLYFKAANLVVAWCLLRGGYRAFNVDNIIKLKRTRVHFNAEEYDREPSGSGRGRYYVS